MKLPEDFKWIYKTEKEPYKTAEGILMPTVEKVMHIIFGVKGGYGMGAQFSMLPWDKQADFDRRMTIAIDGIVNDLNVVLDGGDARGKQNILLDKVAQKASQKYDVDPEVVSGLLSGR